ncbi:GTPase [Longispora sp. NPDC051575]|uniref:GTPase n=1 Tax=Longispora sp. NPDC051575 TaxID=3154943 RepID=UPI00342C2C6F
METVDVDLTAVRDSLRRLSPGRPWRREITLMVGGGVGAGKTTTINTLLGRRAGAVGHVSRGTTSVQGHLYTLDGWRIRLLDMPGLGDSKAHDHRNRPVYRHQASRVDGVLLIAAPPRPAGMPTLRVVKDVIRGGFAPRRIVVGLNRIETVNVETGEGMTPLRLPTRGEPDEQSLAVIERLRRAVARDLLAGVPGSGVTVAQLLPYDARTGWNLGRLVAASLDSLVTRRKR